MTVKEPVPEADVCAITAAGINVAETQMNNRANIFITPAKVYSGGTVSLHSQILIAGNWETYADTYLYVSSLRIGTNLSNMSPSLCRSGRWKTSKLF
ncbi:hypothetical protein [Sphingomonas sp. TDK1]|uniref:hypothetical protein n=1 Tax=Sphingomonas sp. TDK1 TaxID=453247 RepID=UPI001E3EC705|nr:hypothetical protein [Sphingomonas sp. TDK1]